MVSVLHEAGKQLVRDCPQMLLGLLRERPGLEVPAEADVELEDTDLSQVLPQSCAPMPCCAWSRVDGCRWD